MALCGAFLLFLIFWNENISTEDRLLKSIERNKKCGYPDSNNNINLRRRILEHAEYYEPTSVGKSSSVSAQNVFRSQTPSHSPDVHEVSAKGDDFRPTTPGHSPGVGNIFERAEAYEPNPVGKSHRISTVADVSEEKVLHPLIPGHSHSPSPDVPKVSGESNNFRPTNPGHSPDVGNKVKHAEYYEPNPVGVANVSAEKVFRPLIPGHGPDVSGVSGDSDDFRPTTPGHSPGAGHSVGPTSDGEN